MADDLLSELGRQILVDLARASLIGALPAGGELKTKRVPKMALAPEGEDFDQRLRGIRRWISVKDYSALAHLHPETIRRRIKAGMPADRDGRNWRIYPPAIADWLAENREKRKRQIRSIPSAIGPKPDHAGHARPKQMEKAG